MNKGYLALVLHGHLPYVRHPEVPEMLEERWLFEALTECYLPLLNVFDSLQRDGVNFRLTLSLSPTLITMLDDELLQERYLKHLHKSIKLAELEQKRLQNDPHYRHLAGFYLETLVKIKEQYEQYSYNLIKPLKQLQEEGFLEIITTCATHGFLPLMASRSSWQAQIQTALQLYTRYFDQPPAGIWLPECAYTPGLDEVLKEYRISYFFVDTHGITHSRPAPLYGTYAPVCTRAGVAAFGRDPDSSRQVWDRHSGYPGDPWYREFYRDIGYDLDLSYIGPFLPGNNIRVDTGFKYHRITGNGQHKEPYLPAMARERAARHAEDFLHQRCRQIEQAACHMDRHPLVVAPYDAELFGHWWYEGPAWLNFLCREIAACDILHMVTPAEYLLEYPDNQAVDIPMCSWGAGGYNEFWLNPSNDWLYKHLHRAEDKMTELADSHPKAKDLTARCLNQAARELLLAQSSDWPFIIHSNTAVEYAVRRFKNHIGRFNILAQMLESSNIDPEILEAIETRSKFLPDIDYHIYRSHTTARRPATARSGYRILMLSWEYPPKTVGGLARHVHDLSCALAALGDEVHVITCPVSDRGIYSLERGVHVHRIHPDRLTAQNFMEWVGQLNTAMVERSGKLAEVFGTFDLVHAHDWLVGDAAGKICDQMALPLVATIHATEHGRNQGLYTDLQRHIHSLEQELANRADLIIGCSRYMGREIARLFNQPADKINIIPNGVDIDSISPDREKKSPGEEKSIVFLGRLVPEKGVQVLIKALPLILQQAGPVKLHIAGKGPYQSELAKLARDLGVAGQVHFNGFVNDHDRNKLLGRSDVAVFPSLYEPFGIVALEAMAAGIPVVVSDTGGLRDIIEHGIDGYCAPPGDPAMLAHYIAELLNNPELARHFTRRARRNVAVKFNWQQIASDTLEVYSRVRLKIS
ncbi:1,4-alpha-glucan branching protein domain-containing protein [Desulfallas thermosapovorans]|uniref:1,4-alpha-glucan branching enzyme n=1 Tax=Desulfallas thermosapovorans DSM 6562 TaxID=1121431 RepID=A0A5S4ZQR5_9FIRM|nr:1,4-alpha-glucan branching protein domain-containing protein [Desulfallas thermosapovorans]TYO93888.1 1,4-alpha-glucan branching enzyme [Desulfallas thermosapovorans DSM 6562]